MPLTSLDRVRIVLVQPAGSANVGSIARILKNMGLHDLILVDPQCDYLSHDGRKMAVHAGDILEKARQVKTLTEALTGCQHIAATTGRDRALPTEFVPPKNVAPWLLQAPSALIFGPEDRGLNNEELDRATQFIRIPSSPVYPSLNLAQAVAVCAYELYCAATDPQPQTLDRQIAPAEAREAYYEQLQQLLLDIGYLYPHTAASRMAKLRRLFDRAAPSPEEIAMLRGLVRQMNWARNPIGTVEETVKDKEDTVPPTAD